MREVPRFRLFQMNQVDEKTVSFSPQLSCEGDWSSSGAVAGQQPHECKVQDGGPC